jgi:hypothetical protein
VVCAPWIWQLYLLCFSFFVCFLYNIITTEGVPLLYILREREREIAVPVQHHRVKHVQIGPEYLIWKAHHKLNNMSEGGTLYLQGEKIF